MSNSLGAEGGLSRRTLLAMGGAAVAAGAVGPWIDPLAALGATKWPKGKLKARDAVRVDSGQFMPAGQFRAWNQQLDKVGPANQRGLRATGSKAHEDYVDELHDLLDRAGVQDLTFENVSMQRWTASTWSLDLIDGAAAGPVRTAAYIPYTGPAPAAGVTAPLALVPMGSTPHARFVDGQGRRLRRTDLAGDLQHLPGAGLPGPRLRPGRAAQSRRDLQPAVPRDRRPDLPPRRPCRRRRGGGGGRDRLSRQRRGRVLHPLRRVIRPVPGLYVDRATGVGLKDQARAGTVARLTLSAEVKPVKTRNLWGFIPGRSSREVVALTSHTDGSNAIEDNGPGALVASAQYLARVPKEALPRTVMILLTTGHFAGGNGSIAFCKRNPDNLVKRANAAITVEHLGLREWDEISPGQMGPTGVYEPGAIFSPGSQTLVDTSYRTIVRSKAPPAAVLKPLAPDARGSPDQPAWPGEGQYLYAVGKIADANFITGPTYLLNWGIETISRCNHKRVRAQAMAFTEGVLALGRKSRKSLRSYTL